MYRRANVQAGCVFVPTAYNAIPVTSACTPLHSAAASPRSKACVSSAIGFLLRILSPVLHGSSPALLFFMDPLSCPLSWDTFSLPAQSILPHCPHCSYTLRLSPAAFLLLTAGFSDVTNVPNVQARRPSVRPSVRMSRHVTWRAHLHVTWRAHLRRSVWQCPPYSNLRLLPIHFRLPCLSARDF